MEISDWLRYFALSPSPHPHPHPIMYLCIYISIHHDYPMDKGCGAVYSVSLVCYFFYHEEED